jgi:hypothetical protein
MARPAILPLHRSRTVVSVSAGVARALPKHKKQPLV